MWTIEDIEAINPEAGQSRFLRHVFHIGAASEKHLCETAELLEQRGSPCVIGFAQLPFLGRCGEFIYRVPGSREGVFVDLAFTPTAVAFTQFGQLAHLSSNPAGAMEEAEAIWLTQVTAVVPLWDKRARLHGAYMNCISRTGLRNEIIGRVEYWMDCLRPECRFLPVGTHHLPRRHSRAR